MNRTRHLQSSGRPTGPTAWIGLLLAGGLLAGCGPQARLAGLDTRPTDPELPRIDRQRTPRSVSYRVGVEGRPEPRVVLVPDLSQPHYTAEERRVLGLDQPRKPDRFETLYPPPRTTQDGVSPDFGGVATGVGGLGGALAGRSGPRSRAGVSRHDTAGRVSGVGTAVRKSGVALLLPVSPWGVGPPVWVRVGINPPRSKAGRSSAVDY